MLVASRDVIGRLCLGAGARRQTDTAVDVAATGGEGQGRSSWAPSSTGKTLGVIGLGAIGALVANVATKSLGMDGVSATTPYLSVDAAPAAGSRHGPPWSMDMADHL